MSDDIPLEADEELTGDVADGGVLDGGDAGPSSPARPSAPLSAGRAPDDLREGSGGGLGAGGEEEGGGGGGVAGSGAVWGAAMADPRFAETVEELVAAPKELNHVRGVSSTRLVCGGVALQSLTVSYMSCLRGRATLWVQLHQPPEGAAQRLHDLCNALQSDTSASDKKRMSGAFGEQRQAHASIADVA